MLLIFASIWLYSSNELLWEYRLSCARDCVEKGDLFQAKGYFDQLRKVNPRRFQNDQLNLTRAFIAEREGNYQTAIDCYQSGAIHPTALVILSEAESRMALGQTETVIHLLERLKLSSLPTAEHKEKVRFLRAQSFLQLKQYRKSRKAYSYIATHGTRADSKATAYLALIRLDYKLGQKHLSRRNAEKLQSRWPGSDQALKSVYFQLKKETNSYLRKARMRMAWVAYRNRDYQLSDSLYQLVQQTGVTSDRAKAIYFRCLSFLKREDPQMAYKTLSQELENLDGTPYFGMAVFQGARCLFLLGRDAEVLEWLENETPEFHSSKWGWECERLRVLALRRMGRVEDFEQLWQEYEQGKAPSWLKTFYHQNGVAFSLLANKPQKALSHFQACPVKGFDFHQRLEWEFWQGLVYENLDDRDRARTIWCGLAKSNPNHFFGIAARHMLENMGDTNACPAVDTPMSIGRMGIDQEALVGLRGEEAFQWARIGRYDWAAWGLRKLKRRMTPVAYYWLRANWFNFAGRPYDSILETFQLAAQFPSDVPLEDFPENYQQLLYPLGFGGVVSRESEYSQVDPFLVQAIMREETHFNPHAKSSASARGVLQFIPQTAELVSARRFPNQDFNLAYLYNPDFSISIGAAFISQLQESFGYLSPFTIAAYNAGEGAVEKWKSLARIPLSDTSLETSVLLDPLLFIFDVTYEETKRYCQKVLTSYYQYRRIYLEKERYPQVFSTNLGTR